jgi:hypothetical protein
MEHLGPIRPHLPERRMAPARPIYIALACAAAVAAALLALAGAVDPVVALVVALLIPPAVEMLTGDGGWARLAFFEAFPEPAVQPTEEELELLAFSASWSTGMGGCPWPVAPPPGRLLRRHDAEGERTR